MRLWTIHPKYLDSSGLIACWRETLLAKHVLKNATKGYKNHPQLIRFKKSPDPVLYINYFLYQIYLESVNRGFNFDKSKVDFKQVSSKLNTTTKQVEYEFNHLQKKLKLRSPDKYTENSKVKKIDVNDIFTVVKGKIEDFEKISLVDSKIYTYKKFIYEINQ